VLFFLEGILTERQTFGELSGVFIAVMLLAVPLFVWGPRIRHYTSTKWRLISVDHIST